MEFLCPCSLLHLGKSGGKKKISAIPLVSQVPLLAGASNICLDEESMKLGGKDKEGALP